MSVIDVKRAGQDILAPLHYASLEEAGLSMLFLSSLSKLSEYKNDEQRFERKYDSNFESFSSRVSEKTGQESFEEEDDWMAWKYAHEARGYWQEKVEELDRCFSLADDSDLSASCS